MKLQSIVPAILFGVALTSTVATADTLTITKVDDIHIVNQGGVDKAVLNPNDGNSKMLSITGFKC